MSFTILDDRDKEELERKIAEVQADVDELEESGGNVVTGEDGGYYTPEISQPNADTMTVSYTPSKEGMQAVEPQTVQLPAGKNGTSPAVSVSAITGGHRITITDAEGEKIVDVLNGKDGTSVTVKSVSESTADGGSNVVTFSDGKNVTIKNGSKGNKGDKGDAGYTPQKGTDYWTADDIAEINTTNEAYIVSEMAKREQLEPLFANSIEECTDKSKVYVLPDGYIYGNMKYTEEVVTPGETVTTSGEVTLIENARYSLSGGSFKTDDTYDMLIIPVNSTSASITVAGMTYSNHWSSYYGVENNVFTNNVVVSGTNGGTEVSVTSIPSGKGYMTLCVIATDTSNLGVVVNGESFNVVVGTTTNIGAKHSTTTTTEGSTEIVETEGFVNTGHAFVPADYEARIIALENEVKDVPENTARIAKLESQIGIVDENAVVHDSVGTTFPPSQKPASAEFNGYDLDILNSTADDVYAYIDEVVNGKNTVTKEIMGKDESGSYDIARYTYANREYIAWQRNDHPRMYAWMNGNTIIYSASVSPRIGDTMYSTAYIGTAYNTVTAVSATNRSRTVNSLEFVRYESGDVEPTVIYIDADDDRNNNASITQNGITYHRYPLGDLGANREKLIPIFIYANEHGIYPASLNVGHESYQKYETKMCALVAARLLRDIAAGKQSKNPLYKYIRENCMLVIVPVVNPHGFNLNVTTPDTAKNGYTNFNGCNINRNYDTPGWDVMLANGESVAWMGEYPGSENETQYIMNTMVESNAVVAMSLHGLGGWAGYCAHQGQSPDGSDYDRDKLGLVNTFLQTNYGYTLRYYDLNSDGTPAVAVNTPDITSKSPSYITQCGAYGGIVEFQPDDVNTSGFLQEMKSNVVENAYAQTLNLLAMWLSDYLEQQ